MGHGDPVHHVLLERGAEVAAIEAAIDAARTGAGSTLLIEGAAGIGKTRLLAHACQQAHAAGMTVLTARAAEYEDGYAWGVVRQLFEAELRAGSHPDNATALAARVLTRPLASRDEDTYAVLHGLYWLTADKAQLSPLLLAIDDLHWADLPSQRFVAHLAHRLDGLPMLLAVTVREPRAGTARDKALLASLAAEPSVLLVRPSALSADACGRLVGTALGGVPDDAFVTACQELTGGNPLLLGALVGTLAAEGVKGTAADVPHLLRLTPDSVSRHVLLRLGRMPTPVLAAARAIAVLGNSATTARVGRLADLGDSACAYSLGTLMAEQLVEGKRSLSFVHPLVRSAVYEDLAPPVRQRWHKRAARLLDAEGADPAEVTVHLLGSAAGGDPWVVERLRQAAADALNRGAPEIAAQCLERALAEPPPMADCGDVLYELGAAQTFHSPTSAARHLTEALARAVDWPRRAEITLTLSDALAVCGRFAEAVTVLRAALNAPPDPNSPLIASLQTALLTTARWDLGTRMVTRRLYTELIARADAGEELDPDLHANVAIELTAAGTERERAVLHAREAIKAASRLPSAVSTALPAAVTVLLFADSGAEAWEGASLWLRLAQQRGRPLASALASSMAALISLFHGDVPQTLSYGQQAIAEGNSWITATALAFMVLALIDRGDTAGADALLARHKLARDLLTDDLDAEELLATDMSAGAGAPGERLPIWPYNVVRYARGCLYAAVGEHDAAITDLTTVGLQATLWGIQNPATTAWRSTAALSLNALGNRDEARDLVAQEIDLARRWGAPRALGVSLRAAGLVEGGERGIALLTEAVSVLRGSPARLELARALGDLGAAHRRAGGRGAARDLLRESLDLAQALGGQAVAARAREELVAAGGRPRRDAIHGRDALTPSELRVAALAAAGRTNRQIAQALFVTQRTVENHLTSAYAKLGISARPELATALGAQPRSAAPADPRSDPPAALAAALTADVVGPLPAGAELTDRP